MNSDTIERRKLWHEVYARLAERIRVGEFAPGQALPSERELMLLYGVGRPAVREAMQALAASNIVEIKHGERARVVLPTAQRLVDQLAGGARHLLRNEPGTLGHMKDARLLLEAGLVRIAAERASADDVARLRQRLADQQAALVELDQFVARDRAFHREIAVISANPIFVSLIEAIFDWAAEYYRTSVRAPGAEALTLAEHGQIVDAIAVGDADGAERALRDHLERANELYRRVAPLPVTS
jgi:DNA-binding FadR family transcriptional regulator